MRICDICRGDTIETWQVAVVRISIERLTFDSGIDPMFQHWDACAECLAQARLPVKVREKEGSAEPGSESP